LIRVVDLSKAYRTSRGWNSVLENVNLEIPPGARLGILGRNGAGKSTLINLLGGVDVPDSGKIERSMTMSWPLAFSGAFQGSLTGLDNLRFICRIYDKEIDSVLPFVKEFAELDKYFYEPVKSYSAGMRARLAFALSMAIDFDCYLIDEVLAVGDGRFLNRCREELLVKRRDRAMVLVAHQAATVREVCDRASVLHDKKLHHFDDMDEAYEFYEELLK
jgi:capsular polysaccharide transport system ATP-binding protein